MHTNIPVRRKLDSTMEKSSVNSSMLLTKQMHLHSLTNMMMLRQQQQQQHHQHQHQQQEQQSSLKPGKTHWQSLIFEEIKFYVL